MTFLNRLLVVHPRLARTPSLPSFSLPHLHIARKMSAAAAIAKLHSPLRELVAGVADAHQGKSEKERAEVSEWIENVAAGQVGKPDGLKVRIFLYAKVAVERSSLKCVTEPRCSAYAEHLRREQLLYRSRRRRVRRAAPCTGQPLSSSVYP